MTGKTLETAKVEFRGTSRYDLGEGHKAVVTVDPTMPLRLESKTLWEFGGAPSATYVRLLGDLAGPTAERMAKFRAIISSEWPDIRNLYEYYLNGQVEHFDSIARRISGGNYPQVPTSAARDSFAFRAVALVLTALETSFGSSIRVLDEFSSYLPVICDSDRFLRYAHQVVDSGSVLKEQRRLWDCVRSYIGAMEAWFPGAIVDVAAGAELVDMSSLRLCRDDFERLRDIYVSSFEACCKSITHVVAMINTTVRGSPDDMRSEIPTELSKNGAKKLPAKTLGQFERVSNYIKITYLDEWPVTGVEIRRLLDNKMRNAIGHNSVRHNLRTGHVENDAGESINYAEFVRRVYCLGAALLRMVHFVHTVRISSTAARLNG